MERNRRIVVLQNYRLSTLLILMPLGLLVEIGLILYSFVGGWWKEELRSIGYFFNPWHWPGIIRNRHLVQSIRIKQDKFIVKKFTSVIEFQDVRNIIVDYFFNPILTVFWQIIRLLIFR